MISHCSLLPIFYFNFSAGWYMPGNLRHVFNNNRHLIRLLCRKRRPTFSEWRGPSPRLCAWATQKRRSSACETSATVSDPNGNRTDLCH